MRTPLLLTTLTLLLAACGQPVSPSATSPTPSSIIGGVALPVTTSALNAQALTFREGDVTFTRLGAASVQSSGGFNYIRAQYEVKNVGTAPFQNLTLVAVAKQGNVGGTAIKSITDFGGAAGTDQASLAVQSTALHSVTVGTDGSLSLVPGATDFQAFTPAEVAALTAQNGWNTYYGVEDKPLNYGFTVSKCSGGTCTRTLNPGESGTVNVALRIPRSGATGNAYAFTVNFALVDDSVVRVTRSITPAETATEASARLTALGVPTGGEVMTVGTPTVISTAGRMDVNTERMRVVSAPFVTTLADSAGIPAQFNQPNDLAIDANGSIIVLEFGNQRISKIDSSGVISLVAGGIRGFADGVGGAARFRDPFNIALDASGNIIVGDYGNHRIRKVTPAGVVTTLAGSSTSGLVDGTGNAARFNNPRGVDVDKDGNIIVIDSGNHSIRKISPIGQVTTLAGNGTMGYEDGLGTAARFTFPTDVAVDIYGSISVTDTISQRIRRITPTGEVSTLAGSGANGSADGTGAEATFKFPSGVAVDAAGNVIVADQNHKIRQITPAGIVTTLAGSGLDGFADGEALEAEFNYPNGIAFDREGNILIADNSNGRIRKIFLP